MSDYYPGEIHIGGPIPQAAIKELIEQIVSTGASLEGYCGYAPIKPGTAGSRNWRTFWSPAASISLCIVRPTVNMRPKSCFSGAARGC